MLRLDRVTDTLKESSIDDVMNRADFYNASVIECVRLLTDLDKRHVTRKYFERVLRISLKKIGMFAYIQAQLSDNTFSLGFRCLSYSTLELLERMGFIVFTKGHVDAKVMSYYVSRSIDDAKMCNILMTDYKMVPDYRAVANAIHLRNYDFAIKWMNGIINNVLARLVQMSCTKGVEWLMTISGINPKDVVKLRLYSKCNEMDSLLTRLGVPCDE